MIKERIIELVEFKCIAKEIFFQKIGMTSANFRGNAKNTPLNSNAIENILSEFPDVNLEWLITGKGSMLKTDTYNKVSSPPAAPSESNGPHECIYKELFEKKEAENKALNREIGELTRENRELREQVAKKTSTRTSGTSGTVSRVENIPQLTPAEPVSIP